MSITLQNFNQEQFLKDYWQQKPLVINKAFLDFNNPLDGNELAGLSLESVIESRIIQERKDKAGKSSWQVQHGPFTDDTFSQLPNKYWTLLVQAVDHYIDEVAALKTAFHFIPSWRLDDVMISYATEGGNVGPHFDQYDVFLIQASGKRRWKIGQHCDTNTTLTDNPDVKILADFQQQQEYVLDVGDILYVPPGCAHWGIADTDDCITISIGFRAPSHEEIIAQLCDDVTRELTDDLRYKDTLIDPLLHPIHISENVINNISHIIKEHLLNNDTLLNSFGSLMTEPKYADEQEPYIPTDNMLYKRLDARMAYYKKDEQLTVFINGNRLVTNIRHEAFIQRINDEYVIDKDTLNAEELELIECFMQMNMFEDINDDDCDDDCTHDHDHDH